MNLIPSFKKAIVFLLLFGMIAVGGCQKELNNQNAGSTNDGLNFSTKVTVSMVSGFVSDETNSPVKNATVTMGTAVTGTDKYGYFEFRDIEVTKSAGFVTVVQPGYFKGIKTFVAETGQGAFFRIKLISKTNIGSVDATIGGKVTLSNNLSVSLPANAVVNATTGAAYSGAVKVAAFWINPEATDLNEIMPGDLSGIDTAGAIKLLQTFGMAEVELTGVSGELLQIAPGKKATLRFPLSTTLAALAPSSIPLWYFDETNGLWKKDGSALRIGNNYEGTVSHFSAWNVDIPISQGNLYFDLTLVDAAGNPLQNTPVSFTLGAAYNLYQVTSDAKGHVRARMPSNSQFVLSIGDPTCINIPLYTKLITTTTENLLLGTIKLLNSGTSNLSGWGRVFNCSGAPVTKGYVLMKLGSVPSRYRIDGTGIYYFSSPICGTVANASIKAVDQTNQQSAITTVTLVPGSGNIIPSLTACGLSTQTFFNYYIDGAWTLINPPGGNTFHPQDSTQINAMNLVGDHLISNTLRYTIRISLDRQNIAVGSMQSLMHFQTTQTGPCTIVNPIAVHITEYGNIGEYIAGDFNGTVLESASNNYHLISCAFRIKRQN